MHQHESATDNQSVIEGRFPLVSDLKPQREWLDITDAGQLTAGGFHNQGRAASSSRRSHLNIPASDESRAKKTEERDRWVVDLQARD